MREALGPVKSEKTAKPKRLLAKEISCRQVGTLEASWARRGQLGPERTVRPIEASWTIEDSWAQTGLQGPEKPARPIKPAGTFELSW